MPRHELTESAEGRRVVDGDGNEVGVVSGVRDGTAYVDPHPDITDAALTRLGWNHVDKVDYPLDGSEIRTVTDDEITLG